LEAQFEGMEVISTPSALESINRSEIDVQIATAHHYKRKFSEFKKLALEMATLDEETASSCFYALKRDGKTIEGPSVRLAEIIGSAWGNLRYGARIISIDDKFVTAQGMCHDLERNNAASVEVKRRITNKEGRRYSDDMIGTTSNAACSIALRNAIFKIVPMAYGRDIYEAARQVAIGDAKTLETRRTEMIQYFGKMGVTEKMILSVLELKTAEDIGLDDLATLKGLATAIRDGDTTIDETFNPKKESKVDNLNERFAKPSEAPAKEQQPAPPRTTTVDPPAKAPQPPAPQVSAMKSQAPSPKPAETPIKTPTLEAKSATVAAPKPAPVSENEQLVKARPTVLADLRASTLSNSIKRALEIKITKAATLNELGGIAEQIFAARGAKSPEEEFNEAAE
jgi:hypothetical protein